MTQNRTLPNGTVVSLSRQAAAGDRNASERLLALLHAPVHRYALRRTAELLDPSETAKDIAQEALMRIALSIHGCRADSDEQVFAWALRITRNLVVDAIREEARRPDVDRYSTRSEAVSGDDREDSLLDQANPAGEAIHKVLRSVWRDLPGGSAELIRLRFLRGKSWAEVAEALETTPSGARRRFQRLQAMIIRTLDTHIEELPVHERGAIAHRVRRLSRDPNQ
jgi:RNA polymerase sigma factor (sigma-70 family)